jgi:6,7-dimethyl-8-ribityllumazine synthase
LVQEVALVGSAFAVMSRSVPPSTKISGAPFTVALAAASYNPRLVDGLLGQVTAGLRAAGVKASRLVVVRVPGSNELPSAAQLLAARHRPDVIIALGVIVRGDTLHYQLIAEASAQALQRVALDAKIPVINGVVVAENQAQAELRCLGAVNRGAEFARAALAMAALRRSLAGR